MQTFYHLSGYCDKVGYENRSITWMNDGWELIGDAITESLDWICKQSNIKDCCVEIREYSDEHSDIIAIITFDDIKMIKNTV